MRDCELWKVREPDPENSGQTREALRYSLYEKKISNARVMDKTLAMPHFMKLATLPVNYCTVMYCKVNYCTTMYCKVNYCTVMYCKVNYHTAMYCKVNYVL